ncbi:hypothetical protein AKO1_006016 [Acrasis kona]|uniref:Uncharacterized protein n=1 Tax=Acrasis kona TaxID=1008807 RepID=A0AAW2ZKM9_9EUKA
MTERPSVKDQEHVFIVPTNEESKGSMLQELSGSDFEARRSLETHETSQKRLEETIHDSKVQGFENEPVEPVVVKRQTEESEDSPWSK